VHAKLSIISQSIDANIYLSIYLTVCLVSTFQLLTFSLKT